MKEDNKTNKLTEVSEDQLSSLVESQAQPNLENAPPKPKLLQKLKGNKTLFFTVSLIAIIFIASMAVFYIFINQKTQNEKDWIPEELSAITPKPTEINKSEINLGASINLFYPSNKLEVVNQKPTFFGKIFQSDELLLNTEFRLEGIPYNQEEQRYFLRFVPGKLKNVSITVDGEPINEIYGFAQYPTVQCDILHPNPNGSSTYKPDAGLYGDSPNLEPLKTKADCVDKKRNSLPPVLFFFKSASILSVGQHTINITMSKEEKEFNFMVTHNTTNEKAINALVENNDYPLKVADICPSGYHYRKEYIHIPIPNYQSETQFSQLYLPQNESESAVFNKNRIVYLSFANKIYDLLIPPASVFYLDREFDDEERLISNRYLFAPKEIMVFGNNSPISIWKGKDNSYPMEYMEIIPVDPVGNFDYSNKLPHQTNDSSSCDG